MFQEGGSEQLLTALDGLDRWEQEGATIFGNMGVVMTMSNIRIKGTEVILGMIKERIERYRWVVANFPPLITPAPTPTPCHLIVPRLQVHID